MRITDIGPPDYKKMLPEVIKNNYGKWKYHEHVQPGVLKHTSENGDAVYTIRVGSPRLLGIDFIRDICDLADEYCDGHLRFTSRNNIEFMTPDKSKINAIIKSYLAESAYGCNGPEAWSAREEISEAALP